MDLVVDPPAGAREGVFGFPVGGSVFITGADIRIRDLQIISSSFQQHSPHLADFPALQFAESRIFESSFGVVAGRHTGSVTILEGLIQFFDKLVVGMIRHVLF